jgi:DNA-directed RNA polymerase subunit RPC12/RpoP
VTYFCTSCGAEIGQKVVEDARAVALAAAWPAVYQIYRIGVAVCEECEEIYGDEVLAPKIYCNTCGVDLSECGGICDVCDE